MIMESVSDKSNWESESLTVGNSFTPYKNMLNIGFLQKLFRLGAEYDLKPVPDNLQRIASLLNIEDNDKALVIW